MKQCITQAQLDELTALEKIKLADWADPLDTLNWQRTPDGRILKYQLPLLTIGELIWFLDSHSDKDLGYTSLTERYGPHDGGFLHKGYALSGQPLWYVGMHRGTELCDALWEAVCDVLRKQTTLAAEEEAEEQEWDATLSQPHTRAALRRLAQEAKREHAAGETLSGGFAPEEQES